MTHEVVPGVEAEVSLAERHLEVRSPELDRRELQDTARPSLCRFRVEIPQGTKIAGRLP